MSQLELARMHSSLVSERDRLTNARLELLEVSSVLSDLSQRSEIMVPLGSSAFVPGRIKSTSHVRFMPYA